MGRKGSASFKNIVSSNDKNYVVNKLVDKIMGDWNGQTNTIVVPTKIEQDEEKLNKSIDEYTKNVTKRINDANKRIADGVKPQKQYEFDTDKQGQKVIRNLSNSLKGASESLSGLNFDKQLIQMNKMQKAAMQLAAAVEKYKKNFGKLNIDDLFDYKPLTTKGGVEKFYNNQLNQQNQQLRAQYVNRVRKDSGIDKEYKAEERVNNALSEFEQKAQHSQERLESIYQYLNKQLEKTVEKVDEYTAKYERLRRKEEKGELSDEDSEKMYDYEDSMIGAQRTQHAQASAIQKIARQNGISRKIFPLVDDILKSDYAKDVQEAMASELKSYKHYQADYNTAFDNIISAGSNIPQLKRDLITIDGNRDRLNMVEELSKENAKLKAEVLALRRSGATPNENLLAAFDANKGIASDWLTVRPRLTKDIYPSGTKRKPNEDELQTSVKQAEDLWKQVSEAIEKGFNDQEELHEFIKKLRLAEQLTKKIKEAKYTGEIKGELTDASKYLNVDWISTQLNNYVKAAQGVAGGGAGGGGGNGSGGGNGAGGNADGVEKEAKARKENAEAATAEAKAKRDSADESNKESAAREKSAETAASEAESKEKSAQASEKNTDATKDEQKVKKESAKASEDGQQSAEAQAVADEKQTEAKKEAKAATEEKTQTQQKDTDVTAEATTVSEQHADSLKQEEQAVAAKADADKKHVEQVKQTENAVKSATQVTQDQKKQNQAAVVTIQDINKALEDEQQLWGEVDQQQRSGLSAGTVGPDAYTGLAEQMARSGSSIADTGFMQDFMMKGVDKVDVAKNLEDALKQSLQRARHDNSFSNYLLSQFKLDESDVQNIQSVLQSAYNRIWDMFEKSSGSKRDKKTIASQIYGFEKLSGFGFQGEFDFDKIKSSIGYDSFKQNGSFVNEGKRAIADVWELYDSIMAFIDRTQTNLANTYQKLAAGASQYYRGILSGDQSNEFLAFKEDYERGLSDVSAAGITTGQAGDAYEKYLQIKNQVLDLLDKERVAEGRILTAQEKSQAILDSIDYLHLEPTEQAKPSYYEEQTDNLYDYVQAEKSLQQAEDELEDSIAAGTAQIEQRSEAYEHAAEASKKLDNVQGNGGGSNSGGNGGGSGAGGAGGGGSNKKAGTSTLFNPKKNYWAGIETETAEESIIVSMLQRASQLHDVINRINESQRWQTQTKGESRQLAQVQQELEELLARLQVVLKKADQDTEEKWTNAVRLAFTKFKDEMQRSLEQNRIDFEREESRFGDVIATDATWENANDRIRKYLKATYGNNITDYSQRAGKISKDGREAIQISFKDAEGEAHKFYAVLNTIRGEIRGMEGDASSLNSQLADLLGNKPRTENNILDDIEVILDRFNKIQAKKDIGLTLTPTEIANLEKYKDQLSDLYKEVERLGLSDKQFKKFKQNLEKAQIKSRDRYDAAYEEQADDHLRKLAAEYVKQDAIIKDLEQKSKYQPLSLGYGGDAEKLAQAKARYAELGQEIDSIQKKGPHAKQILSDMNEKIAASADVAAKKYEALAQKQGAIISKGITDPSQLSNIVKSHIESMNGKRIEDISIKDVGNGIYKVSTAFKTADDIVTKFNGTLNTTSGELRAIEVTGQRGISSLSQLLNFANADLSKLIGAFSQYISGAQLIGYAKQQAGVVRELDSSFVELRKVSEDSAASLEQFRDKSYELGRTVGSTAVDILDAAAQWEQLGYNIKEAESLVQASVIFKNVADGMQNEQEATEDLISTMKAFGVEAKGAIDIVDALNEVSNSYSVSAQDLGKILKRSSATLAVAGNSMEQTLALGTAMNEIMQEAGTSGNALKILSLRLRGQKTELADAGEETDGMAESTSKLREKVKALTGGFDIMADANNFKSTYEIMKGIAQVWDDLTDVNRAALLELIAGKNRANAVASLLKNFEQVDNVIKTIENDEGSATRENLIRLDSINGRIILLKNQTQELASTFIDSDFLKDVISNLTKLLDVLNTIIKVGDKFGMSPIAPILGQRFGFKNGRALIGGEDQFFNLKGIISDILHPVDYKGISEFIGGNAKDFADIFNKSPLSPEEFIKTYVGANGSTMDPTGQLANILKLHGDRQGNPLLTGELIGSLGDGQQKAGQFFKNLKQAAATSIQFAAINVALQAFVSIMDEAIHHQERLNASFAEHSNNLKDANNNIATYREKIDALQKIIDDEHSSISEVVDARKQLHEIQSEMIEAYGDEAKIVDGNAEAYERLAKAQYEAAKQSLIADNNGIKENIVRFFKGEQNAYTELISTFENYEQDLRGLEEFIPEDSDSVVQVVTGNNHATPKFIGSLYDAIELYDEIRKNIQQKFKDKAIDENKYNTALGKLEGLNSKALTAKNSGEYLYQAHIVDDVIEQNDELEEQYNLLKKIGDQYDAAAKSNDKNGMEEAVSQYATIINQVLSGTLTDGVVKAFEDIYPLLYEEAKTWTFELNFKANEAGLKDEVQDTIHKLSGSLGHTVSAEELLDWDEAQHNAEENQLVSTLGSLGKEQGFDSFKSFISGLQKLGAVANQYTQELFDSIKKHVPDVAEDVIVSLSESEVTALSNFKDSVQTFEQYYGEGLEKFKGDTRKAAEYAVTRTVVAAEQAGKAAKEKLDLGAFDYSKMASDLERLSKISNDLKNGGNFTWTNLGDDFKEAFGSVEDATGQFGDAYKNFFKVISTAPNDAEKCKQAFDELAGSYIYNSELLEGLTEDNKDAVISMLGSQGIANAAEIVADKMKLNAQAKEAEAAMSQTLEGRTYTLAKASLTEANAELTKGNYSSFAAQQIAKLYLEEQRVNGITINTQADIDNLAALAGQARLTQGELQALMSAINVSSNFQVQGINALSDSARQARLESDGVVGSIDNMLNAKDPHAIVEMQLKNALQPQKIQKQVRDSITQAAEKARDAAVKDAEKLAVPDYVGDQSSSGGGGGGGGNGSDSKTDKEFDWISRFIDLKQRQNDKLRETIDDQYTVYQDSIKQDEDYLKAQNRLAEAEKKLEELGVDPNNYTPTPADGKVHPREDTGEYPAGWMPAEDDIPQWLKDANVGGDMFDIADKSAEDAADAISKVTENTDEAYNEYLAAKEALEAYGEARVVEEKSQLDTLKELIQSDQDLIDSQQSVLDGYKAQWAEYQQQIADQWGDKAPQWIKDITEGNVHPEDWEAVYSYSSSDQSEKDRVESLERGKEAYDAMNEAEDELRKKIKQKLEDEQKEYEIRLNIVKAQQAQIQNLADIAQWELDMKGVLGEVVQESDYQALIDINDDLIANYEEQLDVLNEQLGTLDEGEQAWYDCQSSIYECENAIREARKQQAEWNDTILRLPVENMQRFLKLLQNIGKDLDNFMAVQEAMGKDTTADQISKQWADALDQITADQGGFNAQAEKWLDILENYDLGSDKFSEVDDSIQECEDSVTSLIESMVELNSQLLNLPIDKIAKMTEYLNGTLSDLQSVQSEFETAINSVINAITEEQDKLQKEYDDLEESINDQIKPLEDALDQLEKQNDQRNRQLAIEKAQLELAKQQEQHTLQVIRNGKVQYEQDQGAIRDAQEGLADAEYNKLIGDLNDQIDALNEQLEKASDKLDEDVKELQKILDERWETIMPDTETARNEEIATRIFGEGWKELVLAGKNANGVYADEAMYQAMRKAYEENSVQQRDVGDQIKTNELITSTLQKYVEDFQAEKLTAEEMSEKISTLMNIVNDNLVTGQEALRNTLTMGGYETLGNALQAANTLRENQLGVFNENLQIAQERRDQIDELTLDWEEFAKKFDEYREQLKSDWDAIDFIGEKVSYIQDNFDDDDDDNVTSYWDGPSERNPDDYRGDASYNDIGHYADGLENGQIGKLSSSDKFKAIQALGLKKLEPDEIPAILHAGEGVVNGRQQSNILSNMNGALSLGAGNKLGAMINISMGDLTLPNVTNGKEFAESLAQNFTPIMNQYFSKVFGK